MDVTLPQPSMDFYFDMCWDVACGGTTSPLKTAKPCVMCHGHGLYRRFRSDIKYALNSFQTELKLDDT